MDLNLITILLFALLELYIYLIIGYILLGWIEEVRRSNFYFQYGKLVAPFFRIFRGWFVFGNVDFTPMLGIFLLQIVIRFLSAGIYG